MRIHAQYVQTLWRDERSGETMFSAATRDRDVILSEYGTLTCRGVIPVYPKNMPLILDGEMEKGKDSEPLFLVSACRESEFSPENAIEFLSGKGFKGIGIKTAEKIVEKIGGDLFGFAEREDAEEVLAGFPGVKPEMAKEAVKELRSYKNLREMLKYMTAHGGTYQDACLLFKTLGAGAIEKIKKDPYMLTQYGVAYSVCEAVAREEEIYGNTNKRIDALIGEAFRRNTQSGNTCMEFKRLADTAVKIEKDANMGYKTEPFFLGAGLLNNKRRYIRLKSGNGTLLFDRTLFELERSTVENIKRLRKRNDHFRINDKIIQGIERKLGITYSPEQRKAFELLADSGITVLTGGPGTGKTTVLHGLIEYYETLRPDKKILLCSPTANAARKMTEATGRKALTVHKLLNLKPFDNGEIQSIGRGDIECGLLIVDEASMLDIQLFAVIAETMETGTKILLVGDEDQLESVGPGNVLHDLLRAKDIPSVRLRQVYRQKEDSLVLENSLRIREGDAHLISDETFRIIRVGSDEELKEAAVREMMKAYDPGKPWKTKLLTPVRRWRYPYGTMRLNKTLQENYHDPDDARVIYGGKVFSKGDPVIFMRNSYENGYINGDKGIVKHLLSSEEGKGIIVQTDEKEVHVFGSMFEDLDLAYATTVHKAQGDECDSCIIVLPEKPRNMLRRAIIYVGATRAKQKTTIITTGRALEEAIHNVGHTERTTGMEELLKKDV